MTGSGRFYQSTAEFPVKTGLIQLTHNTFSFILYFDNELLKSKGRELKDYSHLIVFTPCTLHVIVIGMVAVFFEMALYTVPIRDVMCITMAFATDNFTPTGR
jgi:hypothetical protein